MGKIDIFDLKLAEKIYHPIYGEGEITEMNYTAIRVLFKDKIGEIWFNVNGTSTEKVKTISELSLRPITITLINN